MWQISNWISRICMIPRMQLFNVFVLIHIMSQCYVFFNVNFVHFLLGIKYSKFAKVSSLKVVDTAKSCDSWCSLINQTSLKNEVLQEYLSKISKGSSKRLLMQGKSFGKVLRSTIKLLNWKINFKIIRVIFTLYWFETIVIIICNLRKGFK